MGGGVGSQFQTPLNPTNKVPINGKKLSETGSGHPLGKNRLPPFLRSPFRHVRRVWTRRMIARVAMRWSVEGFSFPTARRETKQGRRHRQKESPLPRSTLDKREQKKLTILPVTVYIPTVQTYCGYQRISTDIKAYQRISTGINGHQSISTDINGYKRSSADINGPQRISAYRNANHGSGTPTRHDIPRFSKR